MIVSLSSTENEEKNLMISKSMIQYHCFSILIGYVGLLGFHWWLSGKEFTCDIGSEVK